MSEIAGKLTLVTGSTKGIGKAIAEAFVEQGARVVVHGRGRDEAKQLGESIGAYASVYGDLGTAAGCDNVIEQLEKVGQDFNQSHPTLSRIVGNLIDVLGQRGI